jgi:hypothetical protein
MTGYLKPVTDQLRQADFEFVRQRHGRDQRSCDQVETAASFALLFLGRAQSLDSTLFFRGISFCSNGAGRRQKPDSRQQ